MNSSKNGSSSLDLSQKLGGKYGGQQQAGSTEGIHTLANGHQMISTASLPRYADGKWEKKKIRALNQRKGSLDSRSFILAASPDIPPLPPSLSNHNHSSYYPLPLLSLPSQPNLGAADVFDGQPESDYFSSLHHRHHLHLHQHHLIDPAEPPSSLLLSSLANGNATANSLNFHHVLDRNTLDRNVLERNILERNILDRNTLERNASPANALPHQHSTSGLPTAFQQTTNDSYLFSPSEAAANACSHCSYELYDCHNLDSMGASCDLMLLPTSSYHHLHFNKQLTSPDYHHLHGGQYPAGHQCTTANEFSWAGYNTINDSLDYHQQNLTQSRSKEPIRTLANGAHSGEVSAQSHQNIHQGAQSGPPIRTEEERNAQESAGKEQEASEQADEKSNRRNETSEEHSSTSRQSRLQRTQSFTVEEVDLSEA